MFRLFPLSLLTNADRHILEVCSIAYVQRNNTQTAATASAMSKASHVDPYAQNYAHGVKKWKASLAEANIVSRNLQE